MNRTRATTLNPTPPLNGPQRAPVPVPAEFQALDSTHREVLDLSLIHI